LTTLQLKAFFTNIPESKDEPKAILSSYGPIICDPQIQILYMMFGNGLCGMDIVLFPLNTLSSQQLLASTFHEKLIV
jgi:hypothetical protein